MTLPLTLRLVSTTIRRRKTSWVVTSSTDDDQYCVIPRADIGAREATTDKAIGLPVSAVELEPKNSAVAPEYWFDSEEVKEA